MNAVERFLATNTFWLDPGYITPAITFRQRFAIFLRDDPAAQNYWLQKPRVFAALRDLGFPIGHPRTLTSTDATCIGNLNGPGATRLSFDELINEDGWLVLADTEEQP